jgi:hypothetical protein
MFFRILNIFATPFVSQTTCLQRRQLSLCDAIEVSTPQCRPRRLQTLSLLSICHRQKHFRLVVVIWYWYFAEVIYLFQIFNAPPDVHRPQEAADYVRSNWRTFCPFYLFIFLILTIFFLLSLLNLILYYN